MVRKAFRRILQLVKADNWLKDIIVVVVVVVVVVMVVVVVAVVVAVVRHNLSFLKARL
jgi:MFS superfamily sulfate permease-like transporter